MAKANERSAAQRRGQVRDQRQQRQEANQNKQSRGSGNVRRGKSTNKGSWYLIGGILLMVVLVIGAFIFLSNMQAASTKEEQNAALKTLTSLDPTLYSAVGTGNANNSMRATMGNPAPLKGPTGKPEFFYVGGEFCPYCAAQRWSVIIALSRFGTFGPLDAITASEGNVPTYTFHNATYQSQYIDFVAMETSNNKNQPLDKLSPEQQQLFEKYDTPPYVDAKGAGSIPFINIGNKWVSAGSYYLPDTLVGLTYPEIQKQLLNPKSDVSKGIIGTANYLTAAICAATNNQPANVCTSDPIPTIQNSLPKATASSPVGASPLVLSRSSYEVVERRRD